MPKKNLTSMDPCAKNNAHLRGSDMVWSVDLLCLKNVGF